MLRDYTHRTGTPDSPYCEYCSVYDIMKHQNTIAMGNLSVRPSVKRVHCDKTEESYVYIFISYERLFILVF